MIVPTFWAEGRVQERVNGKQVTIRRFGWSDVSQAEAQANADARAQEGMRRFKAGDDIERREPKVAYNGAEGVPIREEIVSRQGETIVTRNLYGARCLNTPDVLFADIDFGERGAAWGCTWSLACLVIMLGIGRNFHSWTIALFGGFIALILGFIVGMTIDNLRGNWGSGAKKRARQRVEDFAAKHPDWHLRLYETPAGLRVLVMHRTFKPDDPDVKRFFDALGTDRLYAQMCANQRCFRARVSPKPWRIGIGDHLKPRPGVWPVNPARLPERNRWIEEYERKAEAYASCRFVETLGSKSIDPAVMAVQRLHDELSRATSELPIA